MAFNERDQRGNGAPPLRVWALTAGICVASLAIFALGILSGRFSL